MSVTLIIGGARSGKSRLGESLAGGRKHFIATAQAGDEEMGERIARHREGRGDGWTTHEEEIEIARLIRQLSAAGNFVLVDCLTIWLSNLLMAQRDWRVLADELCAALVDHEANVALISNEVGLGIVPVVPLGRAFRDAQGTLNQLVASVADNVIFVAAGLPLVLKGRLPPRIAAR